METTNITKEQLNLFVLCGKHYVNNFKDKPSLLYNAIEELLEPAIKRLKKVERQKELVRMRLCKKTSSKHIEQDKNGRYQFTEEDHAKLLEELDAIDEQMVEMPTQIVPKGEYPEDGLSYDVKHAFKGLVIE